MSDGADDVCAWQLREAILHEEERGTGPLETEPPAAITIAHYWLIFALGIFGGVVGSALFATVQALLNG